MQQVEALVDYLEIGPTWRLHGFLRALYKRQQQHIIHLLGLTAADYKDPPTPPQPPLSESNLQSPPRGQTKPRKPHYYKKVESEEMIQISNDLLPGM